jgi:lipid-binding SYLF domain-containing protein
MNTTEAVHRHYSNGRTLGLMLIAALALALTACAGSISQKRAAAQDLVNLSAETFTRMQNDSTVARFRGLIQDAQGLVIFPAVVKAGFIVGAEGGSGVFVARGSDGRYGPPAFYTLASGSVGLQVGAQSTEMVMVLRNQKAVNAVLRHQGKFGADMGVTVGVIGAGVEAATTSALGADIVAIAVGLVGIYGGVSLEGAALVRRSDLNEAYYAPGAEPHAIVIERRFTNPGTDTLAEVLRR